MSEPDTPEVPASDIPRFPDDDGAAPDRRSIIERIIGGGDPTPTG